MKDGAAGAAGDSADNPGDIPMITAAATAAADLA
jgi:hypothetical protein